MKAYILKISFQQIEPEVWRRVVLPAGATFKRLHDTIQEVTNFQDYHSYAFETKDLYVTNNEELVLEFKGREFAGRVVKSPSSVKIDDYLERESSITYNYDFGDDWRLDIELENIVDDYYFGYPTILAGEGTAPPEDVGGVPGYADFLSIYENRSHPEFLSMYAWAEQQRYVPFDLDWTNDFLKFIKYKKTEWNHIQHKNYAILQDAYRSTDIIDITNIPNRDEMIQYAIASANLYGMIGIQQFLKTYNEQNNTMLGSKTLMALVNDKEVEQKLAEGFVYFYRGAFLQDSIEIEDYDPFMSNVLGKPYYVPEKQELLRYVDEFYYEKMPQQDVLICELAKDFFGGSKVLAGAEVSEFVLNVQVAPDEVNALVQGFLQAYKWDGREQLNDYVQMLMHVVNTTRLWENRGHTAEELFEMEKHYLQSLPEDAVIENGVKVGRNDPCPCGSEKKYKKCCGKG